MSLNFKRVLRADPVMAQLMRLAGPFQLEPRGERTPFEALARAIAHQQLHGVAAQRILARFVALYGSEHYPQPQQVLDSPDEALRGVGFSYAKIAALKDLAQKTLNGIVPSPGELATLSDELIIERLTQVRGIGRWTVEMLLMFQLERTDVLPVDDFGVRNGFRLAYGLKRMPTPRALAEFGQRWQPYRSIAAWYLWRACELAQQQRLPVNPLPPKLALQPLRKKKHSAAKKPKKKAGRKAAPKKKAPIRGRSDRGRAKRARRI